MIFLLLGLMLGSASADPSELAAHRLDVEKFLQKARITETRELELFSGDHIKLGGNKVLQYTNLGLRFLIAAENVKEADPVIVAASVVAPYKGRSPNGLHIGMAQIRLVRAYFVHLEVSGCTL